jgi:hypothetical protein
MNFLIQLTIHSVISGGNKLFNGAQQHSLISLQYPCQSFF